MKLPDYDTHFKDIANYQQRQWTAGVDATPNRGVAVDVGAHVGSFTVRYAEIFDTVIAIEPINTEYLRENTQHLNNVVVQPVGVSNSRTTLYAHNPVPENSGAWELHAQPQYAHDQPVEVVTLDDLDLTECDLIKVDCQGHELAIVQGATRTIQQHRPTLQLEKPNTELQRLLHSMDYKLIEKAGKDWIWCAN